MCGPLNVECQMHRLVKCLTFSSDCIQIWIFLTVLSFMFYRNPSSGSFADMCRQLGSQMGVTNKCFLQLFIHMCLTHMVKNNPNCNIILFCAWKPLPQWVKLSPVDLHTLVRDVGIVEDLCYVMLYHWVSSSVFRRNVVPSFSVIL